MSRFICAQALAALAMAAAPTAAAGQEPLSAPETAADLAAADAADAAQSRFASQLPVETALTSGIAGPSVEFRAEGDASEAAIFIGDTRDSGWFNAWSVRFATPIQKGETSGNFITDGGLTGSSSVRVAVSRLSGNPPFATPLEEQRTLALQAIEACAREASTSDASACSDLSFARLRRYLPEHLRSRLADPNFEEATVRLWTVALEVGHQEITWRDPLSLAEQETQRTPYSLSASLGWSFDRDAVPVYLGLGFELSREYPGVDDRTLCAPPPAAGPQECFTGRFGAPEHRDSQVAHFVGRFQRNWPIPFAVELKPAYDLNNDIAELAATLYFVPGADGGLRGGLRARWRTEDDDPMTEDERFTFGVFVGAPFSLGAQ